MRHTALTFATLLIAAPALAQTVAPAEPISSNPIPFNTQRAAGDGVPIPQPAPAPIGVPGSTPPSPPLHAAPPAGGGFGLAKVFEEADTNKDGVVTREEFIAKANQHFGIADKNKDNKITREEMQAQQSSFMNQMQRNLFGNGGGSIGGKIDQFLGTGQTAPANLAPIAPVAPVVPRPVAPAAPTTGSY